MRKQNWDMPNCRTTTNYRNPTLVELAAHDGETTTARETQEKIVKVLSGVSYKRFIESFDILPSEPVPPSPNDLQWDRVEGAKPRRE